MTALYWPVRDSISCRVIDSAMSDRKSHPQPNIDLINGINDPCSVKRVAELESCVESLARVLGQRGIIGRVAGSEQETVRNTKTFASDEVH